MRTLLAGVRLGTALGQGLLVEGAPAHQRQLTVVDGLIIHGAEQL